MQTELRGLLADRMRAKFAPMTIDARLADAWARLPDYLGGYVLVSITALAIGLGISLPLARWVRYRSAMISPRGAPPLGATSPVS